jgi:hypothetical protein
LILCIYFGSVNDLALALGVLGEQKAFVMVLGVGVPGGTWERTKIVSVMALGESESPGYLKSKNSFSASAKSGLFWMLLTAVLFIAKCSG